MTGFIGIISSSRTTTTRTFLPYPKAGLGPGVQLRRTKTSLSNLKRTRVPPKKVKAHLREMSLNPSLLLAMRGVPRVAEVRKVVGVTAVGIAAATVAGMGAEVNEVRL
jgi:hypothetical protein